MGRGRTNGAWVATQPNEMLRCAVQVAAAAASREAQARAGRTQRWRTPQAAAPRVSTRPTHVQSSRRRRRRRRCRAACARSPRRCTPDRTRRCSAMECRDAANPPGGTRPRTPAMRTVQHALGTLRSVATDKTTLGDNCNVQRAQDVADATRIGSEALSCAELCVQRLLNWTPISPTSRPPCTRRSAAEPVATIAAGGAHPAGAHPARYCHTGPHATGRGPKRTHARIGGARR